MTKLDAYFSQFKIINSKIKQLQASKQKDKGGVKFDPLLDAVPSQPPRKKKRGPLLDENVRLSICDMGNGCWTFHHFTSKI